ncbi:prepilin-type N-terminal cleavage/methylation domain-containing protein [Vibrio vulnificus]|uniref:Prepilin-type N-terminal cleavage/methylation domain-containing protein n=1 Tax=Vibrio vulnificus TaxID=672 RepID=A0AAW4HFM3_VIBVL|nr:prepilin-type N-terminal cleavage/methylation domain-containing protein [Vibrio vulnificus]ELA3117670.1 prepilin-type N-terminal cleavage/methylation domain-containing protein [Vibrio vulnificus]ELL0561480.1 prepilin-type N-terminal cleavage/methylation domain-containing protein [Vibrio vulnificus]ELV8767284.1 prepilin-type N-terminal cleavage/methylation domain-containing protein [Vibrio vulnificus]EMB7845719.1 prepilin-type N-terminal cleavage/methylation domain-containing protein [Vibrio 
MRARGFTLVEMVLTLIVGSILVLGIAGFVELGTKGYADSVDRQRIQTQAQFVLEKLSREFRHAVPNSFSDSGNCLSFYPIVYSGFYALEGNDIQFLIGNTNATSPLANGLSLVINPSRQQDLVSDSFDVSGLTNGAGYFAVLNQAASLESNSINRRHYIFNANGRVEYCFTAGRISRNGVQVADSVSAASFNYLEPTLQRGGLVHIKLTFTQNDESSHYQQDVQVLNVP